MPRTRAALPRQRGVVILSASSSRTWRSRGGTAQ